MQEVIEGKTTLEVKTEDINEEIAKQEKMILDAQATIKEQKKELEELAILKRRLRRIHNIKFMTNLGDPDKIAALTSKYRLTDLLQVVAKLTNTNPTYPLSLLPIINLNLWKAIYLFFGDDCDYEGVIPDNSERNTPEGEPE